MSIISVVEKLDPEIVKRAFTELLADYVHPAFGSISKRDFDILLFMKLQSLGVIAQNPELYDVVTELRVTRSKARNLLYESKLRHTTSDEMDVELKNLLLKPIFIKDSDRIGIEIENPFLIDHFRSRLKKLGHITDGSFSPELVRLTTDAYLALFVSQLPEESKSAIKDAFVAIGAAEDASLKGVLKGALKKLGTKVADEAGGAVAESVGSYLEPIISGSISGIHEMFTSLFQPEEAH